MSEHDELDAAQEQLGKAIDRARAGEDRQLAQQVRDLGEQVVRLLNGLLRLTQIHDPRNAAFEQPVRDLAVAVRRLYDLLGAVRVVCVEGQVYLNDIRVRLDERFTVSLELAEELARHGAGGLTFHEPLDEAAVRRLIFLLAGSAPAVGQRPALTHSLVEAGLRQVSPTGFFRLRLSGEVGDAPTDLGVERSFLRAGALLGDVWDQLAAGRMPNPVPLRRVVTEIVDASAELDIVADEAALPDEGASAYARHCRRVCAMSIVVGRDLGLTQASLADLGVAAMFHDAGYASRRDGQPPGFDSHPIATLRVLLRQRGFHPAKLRRQLASVHHHRNFTEKPVLYGRILRVADDFDTLTRDRADGPLSSPPRALRSMAGKVGRDYDPAILQIFVNRLGRYPPGTVLRLADGRIVMTTSGCRDPSRFATPLARVMRLPGGRIPTEPAEIDLALEGAIVAEVDPRSIGLVIG